MKGRNRAIREIGKITLTLLMNILMPVLNLIGLGVVINRKIREKKIKQPTIGKPFDVETCPPPPVPEAYELLARTGNYIHEPTFSRHCWEILDCPPEKRNACPYHVRRDLPFWVVISAGKSGLDPGLSITCSGNQKEDRELTAFPGRVS